MANNAAVRDAKGRAVLDSAEGLATRAGLAGLTIARLAEEVGMSKGGVFAHFGSKEALQLATFGAARERFAREVMEPALREHAGLAMLRAGFELYFAYVARRLASGGCFFTATTLEMADRPGLVREQIAEFILSRQAFVTQTLRDAIRNKELVAGVDAELLAFELASIATGAMVELQMFKAQETLDRVRRVVSERLTQLTAVPPKTARRKAVRSVSKQGAT